MKRENINYFVVGLFVLIMMIALFIFLYSITGRTGPADQYFVSYSNVAGINYGTPVLFEGYQVGQVEAIEPVRLDMKTRYRLALSIEQDWPIPDNSVAQVIASGLLSVITIDIKEGSSETLLPKGSEIQGKEAANLFAAVNEVAADFNDLSQNSVKPLIANLNKQINALTADFTDLANNSIKPAIEKFSNQLDQPELISELNLLVNKMNATADNLNDLFNEQNQKNISMMLQNINNASSNMNQLLNELENTRATMDLLLSNMDTVVGKFNYLIDTNHGDIESSFRNIRKTLSVIASHIETVSYHIEGSSRNFHEFTRQIKEHPAVILRSSPQIEKVK